MIIVQPLHFDFACSYMRHLLFIFASFLLCGCATIFHPSPDTLKLDVPKGISVANSRGEALRIFGGKDGPQLAPRRIFDDTLVFSYQGLKATTVLIRNYWWPLTLDAFYLGVGAFVDELTHSGYYYNDIGVSVIKGSGGDSLAVLNSNWIGEGAEHSRPQLLFVCSLGVEFLQGSNAFPNLDLHMEYGLGLDVFKKFEIFVHNESLSDIAVPALGTSIFANSSGPVVRFYAYKNFFVQGSLDFAQASYDSTIWTGPPAAPQASSRLESHSSNNFKIVGFGIGWAGDFSFAMVRYYRGLQSIAFPGYQPTPYSGLFFTAGVNLRL
jgi:hypothetical protein